MSTARAKSAAEEPIFTPGLIAAGVAGIAVLGGAIWWSRRPKTTVTATTTKKPTTTAKPSSYVTPTPSAPPAGGSGPGWTTDPHAPGGGSTGPSTPDEMARFASAVAEPGDKGTGVSSYETIEGLMSLRGTRDLDEAQRAKRVLEQQMATNPWFRGVEVHGMPGGGMGLIAVAGFGGEVLLPSKIGAVPVVGCYG